MSIAIVKNNMGGLCQIDMGWHGLSGTFRKLEAQDRRELKELREQLAEQKAANKNGWDV